MKKRIKTASEFNMRNLFTWNYYFLNVRIHYYKWQQNDLTLDIILIFYFYNYWLLLWFVRTELLIASGIFILSCIVWFYWSSISWQCCFFFLKLIKMFSFCFRQQWPLNLHIMHQMNVVPDECCTWWMLYLMNVVPDECCNSSGTTFIR
jgi:hypothetical protein